MGLDYACKRIPDLTVRIFTSVVHHPTAIALSADAENAHHLLLFVSLRRGKPHASLRLSFALLPSSILPLLFVAANARLGPSYRLPVLLNATRA